MYKMVFAGSMALLLCACGSSQPPQASVAPATPRSVPAAAASSTFVGDRPDELVPPRSAAQLSAAMLHKVLSSPSRSKADKALDKDRHPARALAFFGLRPDMDVIEVDPGKGWYASILAPLLKQNGTYNAAMVSSLSSAQARKTMQALRKVFDADPERYSRARLASFDPHTPNLGTPDSADMVLSFRDVHAWIAKGNAHAMFGAIYDVLKPGGVFGVVDYRAPEGVSPEDLEGTPYLLQHRVVKLATQAGFKLDAASNINANHEDDGDGKNTPVGADRMTLRFVKPASPAHAGSA